ncbi:MAG: hypothetical protein ACUBOA_10505 [Candidatus Loosdrechtia sp.]|uniref:hypothetical protein n=1 Tax=Candidatus Loosdrechtia sp. TaxID=3101272 RepID=UPI003A6325D0|nr:MAG: hypothetical protein QY305_05935 [Candidatus Jettenia sp. AMX2]
MISEKIGSLAPFPYIPDETRTKHSSDGLFLRPFGVFKDDLAVNFNQKAHPFLVTQILQCCTTDKNGKMPEQEFFWDLTIGKRIECLVTIAMLRDLSKLSVHLRCSNESCQQPMEIDLYQREIAQLQLKSDRVDSFMVRIGEKSFQIRKPTGRDQIEWLKTSFANEDEAIQWMIRSLFCEDKIIPPDSGREDPLSDELARTIDESMEENDPLVNFHLMTHCPSCGKQGRYKINLEKISLLRLRKAQRNLFETVHRLAFYYHWNEDDVFSIPPWRRLHYLALIEREGIR